MKEKVSEVRKNLNITNNRLRSSNQLVQGGKRVYRRRRRSEKTTTPATNTGGTRPYQAE